MTLREWLLLYIRNRDAFSRKLKSVEERAESIVCTYPEHTLHAYAQEHLAVPAGEEKTLIATLQTKENVTFLLKHWGEFSKKSNLTIIFVNPARNEKWLLKPALHEKISDGNIEPGIWSIADGVAYV